MGDPAGIGLDIVVTGLNARRASPAPGFVFVGDSAALEQRARLLGLPLVVSALAPDARNFGVPEGTLGVIDVACQDQVTPGKPSVANAPATIGAIEIAARLVRGGLASALVTNPIAKDVLAAGGFKHPGHTEFLGELSQRYWGKAAHPVMMLAAPQLRVVPVTVHIALSEVPAKLTRQLILDTARTTVAALKSDFGIAQPRLAVCGLNPHAGENGLMGHEEQSVIRPAIETLRAEGMAISGPHSADTLFHEAARATYDAVLAMYHDQALIPLKTLAFDQGVNVTLGLPFVRTSPDHGTAFGIAGTGKASPTSFLAALDLASAMAQRRAGQVA